MDGSQAAKPQGRRLRVRQASPGAWALYDEAGKRLLFGRTYETPAEALNAARSLLELTALLAGAFLPPECR